MKTPRKNYSQLCQEVEDEIERYYSNLTLIKVNREELDRSLDFQLGLSKEQVKLVVFFKHIHENYDLLEQKDKYKIDEIKKEYYLELLLLNTKSQHVYQFFPDKIKTDKTGKIYNDKYRHERLRLMIYKEFIEEKLKEPGFYAYIKEKAQIAKSIDIDKTKYESKLFQYCYWGSSATSEEIVNRLKNLGDYFQYYTKLFNNKKQLANRHPDVSSENKPKVNSNLNILQLEANLSDLILNTDNLFVLGEERLKAVLKLYSKYLTTIRRKEQKQDYIKHKREKYQCEEAVINEQKKKERDERIIELFKKGLPQTKIAKSFEPNISRTTVIEVLKLYKIQIRHKEGKSVKQISKELKLDYHFVHNHLGKLGLIKPPYLPKPITKKS